MAASEMTRFVRLLPFLWLTLPLLLQ